MAAEVTLEDHAANDAGDEHVGPLPGPGLSSRRTGNSGAWSGVRVRRGAACGVVAGSWTDHSR